MRTQKVDSFGFCKAIYIESSSIVLVVNFGRALAKVINLILFLRF